MFFNLRLGSLLTLLLILFSNVARTSHADAKLKSRLVKEYPTALKRLRQQFSHVKGVLTETIEQENRSNSKWTSRVERTEFEIDGESMKTTTVASVDSNGKSQTLRVVRSANPKYVFRADEQSKNGPFALKMFIPRVSETGLLQHLEQFRQDFVFAPFTSLLPIDTFLWDTQAEILDVTALQKDGRNLIKVDYTLVQNLQRGLTKTKCWFIVAPDEGWTVQEQETCVGEGCRSSKIEYGQVVNGIPVPKRLIIQTRRQRRTVDYDELTFNTSPSNDFTFAAVGLPEIELPGTNSISIRNTLWLILAIFLFFVLLILSVSLVRKILLNSDR